MVSPVAQRFIYWIGVEESMKRLSDGNKLVIGLLILSLVVNVYLGYSVWSYRKTFSPVAIEENPPSNVQCWTFTEVEQREADGYDHWRGTCDNGQGFHCYAAGFVGGVAYFCKSDAQQGYLYAYTPEWAFRGACGC